MFSTTNTYVKADYIQPSSLHPYDSSQSPLALLAQTCSSIGKDRSSSTSPILTSTSSLVTKSSSNLSNSDKTFSSTKHLSPLQTNQPNAHRKSTLPSKLNTISTKEPAHYPPLYDPTSSVATLLLRSSLAYLASQQQQQQHSYSTACTMPGCFECSTARYILSSSLNIQPYVCHWLSCNARFSSSNDLLEHIRHDHRSSKRSDHSRFHPYMKPSKVTYINDQLPFFYPHLSLSPMIETTQHTNNHPNINNNNNKH